MKIFFTSIAYFIFCITCNAQKTNENDLQRIKKHFIAITKTEKARNYKNVKTLNFVANYIKKELTKVCDSVAYQNFNVDNTIYKNAIGSLGTENKERIIIGAHYDVCGDSEGADDNASGVVGLLELARLLSKENLKYRIDFVGYSLEEPPFFRTKQMGSYIHAKYLVDKKILVKGMISLETIGFFSDKKGSQRFPIMGMEKIYGNIGSFITVVQNDKNEIFSNQIDYLMKSEQLINTKSFKGSSRLPGVDFSDHLNYWKHNFDAVMITNTAFYRNKNYHTSNDKLDTLDLEKMNLVIKQLFNVLKKIN
ncbi:M28 family peptidase [Polaribacter porphyrae]|uniref:Peptidase M28 n=1 Tax=Polaribacter porphyrae TaxID=1137780 RepID=A0A2S7WNR6_9FLAO|nr:M28 family peptidase [Polaribacter porphyrae]PQJ79240.1 peptidase M28 [Polaribacter porphyrae]